MKKQILISVCFFLILFSGKMISQTTNSVEAITPGGVFDMAYDMFGNKYPIANLGPYSTKSVSGGPVTINALPTTSCTSGYFNIYTDPTIPFLALAQTQTLICQVFSDISNFIISPLTNTAINTNNFKINIFVGGVAGTAGVGSSFYAFPPNANNPNQGVIDGLIYKAIKTGKDPYLNIPVTFSYQANNPPPVSFYHGYVGLNPTLLWNLDVTTPQVGAQNDGYGVLLHEICHALGFHTLINNDGFSVWGQSNNYFTRYDKFLYDANGNPLLTNGNQTACPTSSLAFTASLSAIFTATTGCNNSITTCSTAAQFSTANTHVKVYTPNCYVPGSSLSHFEDMCSSNTFTPPAIAGCTPNPASPGQNDLYFAMSNASGSGSCYMKRYLKEEERIALCDMGYTVNIGYICGYAGALIDGTLTSHAYSYSCVPTESIVGMNDGLNNGVFTYTTASTMATISTSSILANDFPTSGLSISCLEIIYNNAFTNINAGVSGANLTVTATQGSGLALLKYLPKNANGQVGNATYIYVYFLSPNCNPASVCNMVQNNGFENIISPTACGIMTVATGPVISCWTNHEGNPAVVSRSCTSGGGQYDLGNNTIGSAPIVMNSFNGTGNNKVVALNFGTTFGNNSQAIKNNLSSPLVPNTAYKISFMAANITSTLSGNNTVNSPVVISIASSPIFAFVSAPPYPTGLNVIAEFTIQPGTTWAQVAQNFTFTSPGSINHSALLIGINSVKTLSLGALTPTSSVWCYLDEIMLVPQTNPSFNLGSPTVCGNQSIHNLDQFSSIPSVGTYSGTGVSFSGGQYHFNFPSAPLSPGIYPIAYTYTFGGCTNTIYDIVTVSTNTNLFSMNPYNLCASPFTLNLGYVLNDPTHFNGTIFSVNNVSTTPVYTFAPPGVFTISAVNNSTFLCNNTSTTTVSVYTTPAITNFLIDNQAVVSASLCNGYSLTLVGFSPNGTNYLWQPGNLIGASQLVSPSVTTIYTLSVYNFTQCPATQTAAITVYTNCCFPTFTTAAYSGTTLATTLAGPVMILNDITIPSGNAATLSGGEYLMAQTSKIIVSNNATLTIDASHLYACTNNMWQGIVVQNGGYLVTAPAATSNLIEDAVTAIDISSHTNTVATILTASNTIFNKNYIDININSYQKNLTTYPFIIHSNVFTCRSLTFSPTNWPQSAVAGTNDLRYATNTATTGLAAPYLTQGFTVTTLKNPYSAQPSHIGIQLNNIGVTTASVMYGIDIGNAGNSNRFNLFDAHGTGIAAKNSNVSAINNVFQNSQRYLAPSVANPSLLTVQGGTGIESNYTGVLNGKLDLTASNVNTGNRFWDCHVGVAGNKLYRFNMENGLMRSTQVYTATPTIYGSVGENGVLLPTNRFQYFMRYNEFTNINNCINIPLAAGTYTSANTCSNCAGGYGIYAANIAVIENTFAAASGTALGTNFINNAVSITSPNQTPWWIAPGIPSVTPAQIGNIILLNQFDRVFRGIRVQGLTNFNTEIVNNTISLQTDNYFTQTQHGIDLSNSLSGFNVHHQYRIIENYLKGVGTTTSNTLASLIYNSLNIGLASPSVVCNDVRDSYNGFVFSGQNTPTTAVLGTRWFGNSMQSLARGMLLTNTGKIGQQGNSSLAMGNNWNGSWPGPNQTYGIYTSNSTTAALSPLWAVSNTAPSFPPNLDGIPNNTSYATGGISTTTVFSNYSCSAPTQMVVPPDDLDEDFDSNEKAYMAKTAFYRFLHLNDSVKNSNSNFSSFYSAQSGNSIDKLMQTEEKLFGGLYADARNLLAGISPTNAVETNYKNYYNLYANYEEAEANAELFTDEDSSSLFELAMLCPENEGACIYQARALYNYIFKTTINYTDVCSSSGARAFTGNNSVKENEQFIENSLKEWSVELFPNPAMNQITIVSKSESEILHIIIRDLTGRIVTKDTLKTKDFITNLDLELINGVYLITITNKDNEQVIKKLLIAK